MIVRASSNTAFASNTLLYANGLTLMALPFDGANLETDGGPYPVTGNVYFEALASRSAFAVSENGILAYQGSTKAASDMTLLWRDRTGKPLGSISHASIYTHLRLSPDGQRIAIAHSIAQASIKSITISFVYLTNAIHPSRLRIRHLHFLSSQR